MIITSFFFQPWVLWLAGAVAFISYGYAWLAWWQCEINCSEAGTSPRQAIRNWLIDHLDWGPLRAAEIGCGAAAIACFGAAWLVQYPLLRPVLVIAGCIASISAVLFYSLLDRYGDD